MRRIISFVTLALVAAAMIVASALPTFAKQVKTRVEGQQVGEGACTVLPNTKYPTIQSAVDDPSCQTIQLEGGFYTQSATIDRDVTIIGGSADEPTHVGNLAGSSVFTILPGNTVTLEDLQIEGATGEFDGAGIHNQGTLILERVAVHNNGALNGGGIYNEGTLTLNEGSSVYSNLAITDGGASTIWASSRSTREAPSTPTWPKKRVVASTMRAPFTCAGAPSMATRRLAAPRTTSRAILPRSVRQPRRPEGPQKRKGTGC